MRASVLGVVLGIQKVKGVCRGTVGSLSFLRKSSVRYKFANSDGTLPVRSGSTAAIKLGLLPSKSPLRHLHNGHHMGFLDSTKPENILAILLLPLGREEFPAITWVVQ